MTASSLTRRMLLRAGVIGLAGTIGAKLSGQGAPDHPLPSYVADVDGDGRLTDADIQVMEQALLTSRGFELTPNAGFDFRADVFGLGEIDQAAVNAVLSTITKLGMGVLDEPRPITVAWHYGWHDVRRRPLLQQTVRYLDGDYLSNDSRVEEGFNRLKNEFGITVDAIGWIPPRITPTILPNFQSGYFSASNAATRYVALLYENTLALPTVAGRIDFRSSQVRRLLRNDFAAMAGTLVEPRDRYATRLFLLDGRPVMFIFGSHSWGLNPADEVEFGYLADTIGEAREAFHKVYGEFPYLVGEELLQMASTTTPSTDRVKRAELFDALYSYHCANLKPTATTFSISSAYGSLQQRRLERATIAIRRLRNRFHGKKLLIIPSLAGGFAKHGLPILDTTGQAYADFLKQLTGYYTKTYLRQEWPASVGTAALPAPIYTVGSWNEEFEGHAVFPAQFNLALRNSRLAGFDFAMALKQVFGWNHYALRNIPSGP
ncbi:MAG: hypothetical protein VX453_06725 [Acidobacteriota bacterium]|nr:hypothetical protein [Acidobacteriota bacterium]